MLFESELSNVLIGYFPYSYLEQDYKIKAVCHLGAFARAEVLESSSRMRYSMIFSWERHLVRCSIAKVVRNFGVWYISLQL